MKFNIKNVKGDVVASNNQSGGITGKFSDTKATQYKKPIIFAVIIFVLGIIGFLADVFGILDYFHINLF
jgi:hypothetical protein